MQPQDPTNPLSPQGPQPPSPAGPPSPAYPPTPPPPAPTPFSPPTPPAPEQPFGQAPGGTPAPGPLPPQPPTPPAGGAFHGGDGTAAPSPFAAAPKAPDSKKRLILIIVGVIAGILLLAGGTYLVMKMMGGSIKLEEYSNSDVTLLVPVGYEKTEEEGGVSFKEKEGEEGTRSEVIVFYQKLPDDLTEAEVSQVKETLKGQLEGAANSATDDNKEIKDIKITDITFKGNEAFKLTGTAYDGGKKAGHVTLVAGVKDRALFMVGVAAHESDPGVDKKVDEIINSLQVK